jgi:hypothetical protein
MIKVTLVFAILFIFLNVFSLQKVFSYSLIEPIGDSDDLEYKDRIYNPNIKTINLYSDKRRESKIEPPVVNIKSPNRLILEFDELYEDARYFQAKIIHCNWDWTPSDLRPIEYLPSYNEYDILDYEYSVNTKVPFTHYSYVLPRVMLPGNYVLIVYNRDAPEELAFTRRFMVYDQLVSIFHEFGRSMGVKETRTHQQIDLAINYGNMQIFNPQRDIKVVIRQNQSWITAIYDIRPTKVDEISKKIEYRPFNLENNFYGGNEFRFFDLNSVIAPGRNVDRVFNRDDRYDAFLMQDKERGKEFYSMWDDLNGGYIITNIDGYDPKLEAQYVNVHFFLRSPEKIESEIFIFGKLSDYDLIPEFKMKYDKELGGYLGNALLKQGWYDYIYYTPDTPYSIEGSHFETENNYDILVYLKPQGRTFEILAGYISFNTKR